MSNAIQRISFDPANPVQGQDLKICYDFGGAPVTQTKLCVTTKPPTATGTHTVSSSGNCVTIPIPAGAQSVLVEDKDGDSIDKASAVEREGEEPAA